MLALKAAKPATARHGEPAPECVQLGGSNNLEAIDQTPENQDDGSLARLMRIFEARCEARAVLAVNGLLDFHDAVDALQDGAQSSGLVDAVGVDVVQATMAAAFAHYAGFYRS